MEAETVSAPGDVAVSGEGWTLSAPADFVQEELSPFLTPAGTTVGAGACVEELACGAAPVSLTLRAPAAPQALPGFGPAPPPNPVKLKLVARGGSESVVSLAVRRAADVRPPFLQVNDVADFGTLDEAASLFVPPRAKLLASASAVHLAPPLSSDGEPLPRTYFSYEFALGAASCYLVASAKRGKVRCTRVILSRLAGDACAAVRAGLRSAGNEHVAGRCKGGAAAQHRWLISRRVILHSARVRAGVMLLSAQVIPCCPRRVCISLRPLRPRQCGCG